MLCTRRCSGHGELGGREGNTPRSTVLRYGIVYIFYVHELHATPASPTSQSSHHHGPQHKDTIPPPPLRPFPPLAGARNFTSIVSSGGTAPIPCFSVGVTIPAAGRKLPRRRNETFHAQPALWTLRIYLNHPPGQSALPVYTTAVLGTRRQAVFPRALNTKQPDTDNFARVFGGGALL